MCLTKAASYILSFGQSTPASFSPSLLDPLTLCSSPSIRRLYSTIYSNHVFSLGLEDHRFCELGHIFYVLLPLPPQPCFPAPISCLKRSSPNISLFSLYVYFFYSFPPQCALPAMSHFQFLDFHIYSMLNTQNEILEARNQYKKEHVMFVILGLSKLTQYSLFESYPFILYSNSLYHFSL